MGKVGAALANGWQLASVLSTGNTAPYDATFSYAGGIGNVNLTGSPNYTARIDDRRRPGLGVLEQSVSACSIRTRSRARRTAASATSPARTRSSGCWDKTVDLSVSRNIALGGKRQVQFRLDVFNVFNAVVFNARRHDDSITPIRRRPRR